MSQWHGGKGSSRRNEDAEKIRDNWDLIFGKKTKEEPLGKLLETMRELSGADKDTLKGKYDTK